MKWEVKKDKTEKTDKLKFVRVDQISRDKCGRLSQKEDKWWNHDKKNTARILDCRKSYFVKL